LKQFFSDIGLNYHERKIIISTLQSNYIVEILLRDY